MGQGQRAGAGDTEDTRDDSRIGGGDESYGPASKVFIDLGGVTGGPRMTEEEGEMVAEPGCTTLKSAGIFTQRRRNE